MDIETILKTPGNQTTYDALKDSLAEGSPIAFVGAGASAPLYPLWNELIAQLADHPVREGLASDADKQHWLRIASAKPLQVAARIREKLGDPMYRALLRETF